MSRLTNIPFFFVLALLLVGAGIHMAALLGWKIDDEPLVTDVVFLVLDVTITFGVMTKQRWGYWLALLLFLQQTGFQGYWAVWQMCQGGPFGVQQVAALLAVLGLLSLVFFKGAFTRRREDARPGGAACSDGAAVQ